jgi:hypothetical protein
MKSSLFRALVLIALCLGHAGFPAPARSQEALVNRASGVVLDPDLNKINQNGASIQQWEWVSGQNQKWKFEGVGAGRFGIRNDKSGQFLAIDGILGSQAVRGSGFPTRSALVCGKPPKEMFRGAVVQTAISMVLDFGLVHATGLGDRAGNGRAAWHCASAWLALLLRSGPDSWGRR